MTEDPDVLQREIEATRNELAHSLDVLVERVSPKRVATRTSERVKASLREVPGRVQGLAREQAANNAPVLGGAAAVVTLLIAVLTWRRRRHR